MVDADGNRYKDFDWQESLIKNGIVEIVNQFFDKAINKNEDVQKNMVEEQIEGLTKAEAKKLKGEFVEAFSNKTVASYRDEMLASCTTKVQKEQMEKFLKENAGRTLASLNKNDFHKLITSHPEVVLDAINSVPIDWKQYALGVIEDIPTQSGKNILANELGSSLNISEAWKEANRNNDIETQMAIEEMIKSVAKEMQGTNKLKEAYNNRENLNSGDYGSVSYLTEENLDKLISAWISEE